MNRIERWKAEGQIITKSLNQYNNELSKMILMMILKISPWILGLGAYEVGKANSDDDDGGDNNDPGDPGNNDGCGCLIAIIIFIILLSLAG